ncbi:MAG: hypothetical protein Rsou_0793 [Candidatus Ruthia sp. Asou_11_S2]|nr:hypothetical protein [Candidatus Ruthia sp. Asou_11_S2]
MNLSVDDFQKKHVSFSVVEEKNLPFHCPPPEAQKWNMHPKVFLKFDKNGKASCPYCSASYELA